MSDTTDKYAEIMKALGITPQETETAPVVMGLDEAHKDLCIHTKNGEPCAHCDPPPVPKEQHANAGTVDFQCTGLPGAPCTVGPRNKPMKLSGSPNQVQHFLAWFEVAGRRCQCGGQFHSLKLKEREEKKTAALAAEVTAKTSEGVRVVGATKADMVDELSLPPSALCLKIESLAPTMEEVTEVSTTQDDTDTTKPVDYDW